MRKIIISGLLLCLGVFAFSAEGLLSQAFSVACVEEFKAFEKALVKAGEGDNDLLLGIAGHNVADSDEYLEGAVAALTRAWESTGDCLALGYLGSAVTKQGGLASVEGDVLSALTLLTDGLNKIDEAVEGAPDNRELRFLRIFNSLSVSQSSPIDRFSKIGEDLAALEEVLDELDSYGRAAYWYALGEYALYQEDWDTAFFALEEAIRTGSGSFYAQMAENLLWELEE